jgi:glycine cleavage system H protein
VSSDFLETTVDKFVLRVKKGLRYSSDHVWVGRGNEHYSLGLTDYAQRRGGDIVFLEFPGAEEVIRAGEPFASYETIKAALEAKAPFDCEIAEVNRALEDQPELINEDPYGAGWIARIKPVDPESVDSLLSPDEYFELMKKEAEEKV